MSLLKISHTLTQLEKDIERTHDQIRKKFTENNQHLLVQSSAVYCYFTHIIILNHEVDKSHLIMGSFYIKNISNEPKYAPVILLNIKSQTKFNFSAKYQNANDKSRKQQFLWERIQLDKLDPKNYYSFKPTNTNKLQPNEQLSLQNFQIKIPLDAVLTVEGFTYFNKSNDGLPALNSIHVTI